VASLIAVFEAAIRVKPIYMITSLPVLKNQEKRKIWKSKNFL